jgi:predicted transcriptional regulator
MQPSLQVSTDGESRIQVSIRLQKYLDRAIEKLATELDVSKQQIIEDAAREYLERLASHTAPGA